MEQSKEHNWEYYFRKGKESDARLRDLYYLKALSLMNDQGKRFKLHFLHSRKRIGSIHNSRSFLKSIRITSSQFSF